MKTLTFYSYKGGVGRSLALVNIATRLSEFGKKVCIIDFDLEATIDLNELLELERKQALEEKLAKKISEQDVRKNKFK